MFQKQIEAFVLSDFTQYHDTEVFLGEVNKASCLQGKRMLHGVQVRGGLRTREEKPNGWCSREQLFKSL